MTAPSIDKGILEDRAYKNVSLGLEFIPPPRLSFAAPMMKGTPGTVPLLVTVTASSVSNSLFVRDEIVFYADSLAYYEENKRSTKAYMEMLLAANRKTGFDIIQRGPDRQLDGLFFERADFRRGAVYEALLLKACKDEAFVFIFSGSNRGKVDELIASTTVRLDSRRAKCSLSAK